MLDDKKFWVGVGAGIGLVFVYHHFVAPLPSAKK